MIQLRLLWMFVPAVLLLTACGVERIDARIISGEIDTQLDTYYVTRYVFQPNEEGTFRFRVKYRKYIDEDVQPSEPTPANQSAQPSTSHRLHNNDPYAPKETSGRWKSTSSKKKLPPNDYYRIVIYNDKPGQWPYVRKNEEKMTCWEKQQVAIDGGIVVSLSPKHGCAEIVENGIPYIVCDTYRSWQEFNRPRWWFITLQNCGTYRDPGLSLSFEFTMTNGKGYLTKHFSADKKIVLPTNIFFLIVYAVVVIISFIFRFLLKIRRMLHSTYQLHLWSVNLQFIGLACMVLAQLNFAKTGLPTLEWLETTGHVMTSISMLIYILDAILIAKGFTVTRARISTSGCIKITLVLVVYTIATALQYLYQHILADERDSLTIYEIPAAYAEVGLRIFGLAWIYYAITISVKHHPAKGRFYCYFGIFFTAWFLGEPLMMMLANHVVPSYIRAQIVNCAYVSMILFGHICWLILFAPQHYNSLFPYHLKANQVGILQIGEVENNSEKYSDDVAVQELENVANITHECEIARNARKHAREAGRPMPKYNNFFQESAANANPTPAAPVYVVPIQYPGASTDWNIFLASSLAVPQVATPQEPAPVAAVNPATTSGPAVIQTASASTGTTIVAAAKPSGSRRSVVPEASAPQRAGDSATAHAVCRDFSIFLASSMQAQPTSQSQPPAQENTAATQVDSIPEDYVPKIIEFQPASTSSSLSTVNPD